MLSDKINLTLSTPLKTYRGFDVKLHTFYTPTLDGGFALFNRQRRPLGEVEV
jgi:hypothetical protein